MAHWIASLHVAGHDFEWQGVFESRTEAINDMEPVDGWRPKEWRELDESGETSVNYGRDIFRVRECNCDDNKHNREITQ